MEGKARGKNFVKKKNRISNQRKAKFKTFPRYQKRNQESNEIAKKIGLCQNLTNDTSSLESFKDFPLSINTQKGLKYAGFEKPTAIQKDGISLALRGLDVLAAAKTGSGKTLAFIIPVLEVLWQNKWNNNDGLGALVISPTRELAYQTFEVLKKVGQKHDFSAGLIIGGKDVDEEATRIANTNIIICTPGRLLQHFDETPNFHCDALKILILDEADRILDLGFAETMNAIIQNLPPDRQTLLYSATQTKSVKDLARLSLKNPEYISVHENEQYSTPSKLSQSYVVVNLNDKINFLFSFIKSHLKTKCVVFMSSCKQVKFVFEVLRKIRPGIPLMALYGQQKQMKRVGVYKKFCESKSAVLFATDIAARGLDFPSVNWVLQLDCPENAETYIHRAGRTARYEKGGEGLLMLLPSEIAMIEKLKERKIPLEEIKANPKKLRSIEGKLQAFCAQDTDIKYWAQRCIVSYARSVYLQSDKSVFDVTKLPLDKFATSCGLLAPPKVRFMKKLVKKIGPIEGAKANRTQADQMSIEVLSKEKFQVVDDGDDNDDDVLVKKTGKQQHTDLPELNEEEKKSRKRPLTKAKLAKKVIRKNIAVNTKVTFDEDGQVEESVAGGGDNYENEGDNYEGGIDVNAAIVRMKEQDKLDRQRERERIKEKHREEKRKEKQERMQDVGEGMTVVLASADEVNDNGDNDEDEGNSSDEEEYASRRKKKRENEIFDDEQLVLQLLSVS